jgi:hypothetical protein
VGLLRGEGSWKVEEGRRKMEDGRWKMEGWFTKNLSSIFYLLSSP